MNRVVTDHEMSRRLAMAKAKEDVTKSMSGHNLTALEWVNVLHEAMQRMIGHGLKEEWTDDSSS